MTDEAGGAPAPAEPVSTPDVPATPPNPVEIDNVDHEAVAKANAEAKKAQEPAPEPDKKPKSTRDALKDAAAKVSAKSDTKPVETEAKTQDKAEKPAEKAEPAKDAAKTTDDPAKTQDRDETGKFKAKTDPSGGAGQDQQPKPDSGSHSEAPSRFSNDAKAAWATAPESVRAETHRALREMDAGIAEYKEKLEPLKRFDEMAKAQGTTMAKAMENYTQIDALLQKDPVAGLEKVCSSLGFSLQDVVNHVSQQKPDEARQRLEAENRDLKQRLSQLTNHVQTSAMSEAQKQIEAFKADPAHHRYDELEPAIARYLSNKSAETLEEAYRMADLFHPAKDGPQPAPQGQPPAAQTRTTPDPAAQTQRGTRSITGAPSAGSNPAARKPSTSIKDSLKRAMAQAG